MKWCGLLINTQTFEIQLDYTRLQGKGTLRDSVHVFLAHKASGLKNKLEWYLRFRCSPLLFDTLINSPTVVRVNVYQAFMMCAMKCHVCIDQMAHFPAAGSRIIPDAVEHSIGYMIFKVKEGLRALEAEMQKPTYDSCRDVLVRHVPPSHVRWLGLMAYLKVFQRKQTKYAAVAIPWLQRMLMEGQHARLHVQLADIIDDRRNTIFDDVWY